jgi:hypothetical protein
VVLTIEHDADLLGAVAWWREDEDVLALSL